MPLSTRFTEENEITRIDQLEEVDLSLHHHVLAQKMSKEEDDLPKERNFQYWVHDLTNYLAETMTQPKMVEMLHIIKPEVM